jgi:hypothetical protein
VLFDIARALGVTMADLLGHEIRVEDAPQLEPTLAQYAKEAKLTKADVRMLASIKFRGSPPQSVERWRYIHHALLTSRGLDPDA